MASTEKGVQRTVLDYLSYKKIFHWRQNSGTFKTDRGGFYNIGIVGAPDIFCVKESKLYALEIKDIKGKLNPNQEIFRDALEKAGGKYFVIKRLEDLIKTGI